MTSKALNGPKFFKKSDFAGLSATGASDPRAIKRASGKIGIGRRIISVPYSSNAPTLIATENGYAIHPDAERLKLCKPERGKHIVQAAWTGGVSRIFATVHHPPAMAEQRSAGLLDGCQFGSGRPRVLPAGWDEQASASKGGVYFYNRYTGESRWNPPDTWEGSVDIARPLTAPAHLDGSLGHTGQRMRSLIKGSERKPRLPRHGDREAMFGMLKGGAAPPPEDRPLNPWSAASEPVARAGHAAVSAALARAEVRSAAPSRVKVIYLHPGAGPGAGGQPARG